MIVAERCPGSDVAIALSKLSPRYKPLLKNEDFAPCFACGKTVRIYTDPLNLRLMEHQR